MQKIATIPIKSVIFVKDIGSPSRALEGTENLKNREKVWEHSSLSEKTTKLANFPCSRGCRGNCNNNLS